jgi:hypothetical protein
MRMPFTSMCSVEVMLSPSLKKALADLGLLRTASISTRSPVLGETDWLLDSRLRIASTVRAACAPDCGLLPTATGVTLSRGAAPSSALLARAGVRERGVVFEICMSRDQDVALVSWGVFFSAGVLPGQLPAGCRCRPAPGPVGKLIQLVSTSPHVGWARSFVLTRMIRNWWNWRWGWGRSRGHGGAVPTLLAVCRVSP